MADEPDQAEPEEERNVERLVDTTQPIAAEDFDYPSYREYWENYAG